MNDKKRNTQRSHGRTVRTGFLVMVFVTLLGLLLAACSSGPAGPDATATTKELPGNINNLSAAEAAQLVWPKASEGFDDAVLFRMAPVADGQSTELTLDNDWQKTGRAASWFIWYADANGENWLMFSVKGKKLASTDIGTRAWSTMDMDAGWPREKLTVDLQTAASAATGQGANLDTVTWVEMNCDYPAGDFRRTPLWVFSCSETSGSGFMLNYRIFVDAITGQVLGALNDRNEKLDLPIDLEDRENPQGENHQPDLEAFFGHLAMKDWTATMFLLAHDLAPNDSARQMWLANFQSIDTLAIVSIEQANTVQWTSEWEMYKVVLDISTTEPVDQYGWENGENTRWITIIPQGAGGWKIEAISSSP